jgi:hypothetical protein
MRTSELEAPKARLSRGSQHDIELAPMGGKEAPSENAQHENEHFLTDEQRREDGKHSPETRKLNKV